MSDKKSFIYTISSPEKTNDDDLEYHINVGGFSSSYNNYKCEVLSIILDGGYDADDGFLVLVTDNFSQDSYFSRSILSSTETIISHVATNSNITPSSGGYSFRVNNLRTVRSVRFKFLLPDMSPINLDAANLNVNNGIRTDWLLVLKMTELD